jgi:hypothetical protein
VKASEWFLPVHCRQARAGLEWSLEQLAAAAHIELKALALYERGEGQLSTADLIVLGAAFNKAGVIAFGHGGDPGVRFTRPKTLFDVG